MRAARDGRTRRPGAGRRSRPPRPGCRTPGCRSRRSTRGSPRTARRSPAPLPHDAVRRPRSRPDSAAPPAAACRRHRSCPPTRRPAGCPSDRSRQGGRGRWRRTSGTSCLTPRWSALIVVHRGDGRAATGSTHESVRSMSPVTGVVFRPQLPPEDLRRVVEHAEAAGLAELWLWEDCFLEGGLTTAAAALAWSSRLRVGVGLLPVPLRNPALAAMEIATLARLFPGRLAVALGHGVQDWMAQVGAAVESPLTLLREHTVAVRDLLLGETVSVAGRYVQLDGVSLDWPPPVPPTLLIGARGPRSVALAGEVSDGVLLDMVADPAVVRRARELVGPDRKVA